MHFPFDDDSMFINNPWYLPFCIQNIFLTAPHPKMTIKLWFFSRPLSELLFFHRVQRVLQKFLKQEQASILSALNIVSRIVRIEYNYKSVSKHSKIRDLQVPCLQIPIPIHYFLQKILWVNFKSPSAQVFFFIPAHSFVEYRAPVSSFFLLFTPPILFSMKMLQFLYHILVDDQNVYQISLELRDFFV